MDRRNFLKALALTGLAGIGLPNAALGSDKIFYRAPPRKPGFQGGAPALFSGDPPPRKPEDGGDRRAVLFDRSPPRKPGWPRRTVVIDAGHGGKDPGAIGVSGAVEKDVNLDIARALARALEDRGPLRVFLTRNSDVFLELRQRASFAARHGADLFVSIHADSAPNREARGVSAYVLSETASDALADRLARQENLAGGGPGGIDTYDRTVMRILADLTSRHKRNGSVRAQRTILQAVDRRFDLLERPARAANFAVLKAPGIPSVLVETGFLSNPRDERLLLKSSVRREIAGSIASGITDFLFG
jgi:N-acetylmuramoyl-L-alanine amidase